MFCKSFQKFFLIFNICYNTIEVYIMKKIEGSPKTLKQLLLNTKYSIHYYQREYMWQRKHIEELIDDLTSEFLNFYKPQHTRQEVDDYGAYFMGSIVLAGRENAIIDGQQRLTSLTLLLIYLNNRLKKNNLKDETIDGMIFSQSHGIRSFNINVEDRIECMNALYSCTGFDLDKKGESIVNIYNRYHDIEEIFPEEIGDDAILHFCDWLMDKVFFIEIVATTEQDAHKVFVSMNDRGLNLTSTEMLKGYLLSEIKSDEKREKLNNQWKAKIAELKGLDDKGDEAFIKTWLRSQYAETIRESKAGSVNKDFDIIGGPFHKWVRDEKEKLHLKNSDDFELFINKMCKYASVYLKIKEAESNFKKELEYVYYNAQLNFTFQSQLLLAPLNYEDSQEEICTKLNLVARFIDLFIVARVANFKSVDYSTIKNYVFYATKEIRNCSVFELKRKLKVLINEYQYKADAKQLSVLKLNLYTKRYIKHMLARITGYIEENIDTKNNYCDYVNTQVKNPYEVEHIITDHFEYYTDEYSNQEEFDQWRNKLGNLLLLRKSINASINDSKYEEKLKTYASSEGNIYTESLTEKAYINNPRFIKFIRDNNLKFEPYKDFGKEQITERTNLFIQLFNLIWNDKMFD